MKFTPLPMTSAEMRTRGWDACDIILIAGDAYVDHPSFGAALIGRWLEHHGFRVGILAQPDVCDTVAWRELGRPRLFWGVTAGNLDSGLARLTVMRKRRRDDAYSPDGNADLRPANACITYTACARHVYPGVPVVLGGLEASLRRFAYYDYWTDRVRRALPFDAKADILVYGMGERAVLELARRRAAGHDWQGVPGTAMISKGPMDFKQVDELPAYEDVAEQSEAGHMAFMRMALAIERAARTTRPRPLAQRHGQRWLVAYPPSAPLTSAEMDLVYDLPFTRRPHPVYKSARIPAFEMIRDSVTTHRGCFGACSFCAITAHQGATVSSRSEAGILGEVKRMVADPTFRGTITDLGGPTANMFAMGCRLGRNGCEDRNCLVPEICPNLNVDTAPMRRLLRKVSALAGVRHVFISSGIRHDLALTETGRIWLKEVMTKHVGGRMKIAPEHITAGVLKLMRKPAMKKYEQFLKLFDELNRQRERPCQLVEYFISGHPGCTLEDMIELADYLSARGAHPEQVQDYYPAPMTLAAAMYYTGLDPVTLQPLPVARTDREKADQRALLLRHLPQYERKAQMVLR